MNGDTIALILERGGLPGIIAVALFLIWKYAPDRKAPEPAQQVVEALNALTKKIDTVDAKLTEVKEETIDRLARVETEVKNLKERK